MEIQKTLDEITLVVDKMKKDFDPATLDEDEKMILEFTLQKIRSRLTDAWWIISGF